MTGLQEVVLNDENVQEGSTNRAKKIGEYQDLCQMQALKAITI